MVQPAQIVVSGVVEGLTDEAVARRIINHVGFGWGTTYGLDGKASILKRLSGYNQAARHSPWFIAVDLDGDTQCASEFVQLHLPNPSRGMHFRVAVQETEAWLLADRERIASYFRISIASVPTEPDSIADPKRKLVDLAVRSRSRAVREDMVPRLGSGRDVGPGYTSRIIEFATSSWRPEVASALSRSLSRCITALRRIPGSWP